MDHPFAGARFTASYADLAALPPPDAPEIAFAGRSNAGKSSALNAIAGHGRLARVSKTPGRTQLLNFFELPGGGRLVDLPGYGYAQVPEAVRRRWGALVGGYVERRECLRGTVLIMDARHPLTGFDRQMLAWAQSRRRAVHVLLTKADKLAYGAAKNTLLTVRRELAAFEPPPAVQLFSAPTRMGVDEARAALALWLNG